MDDAGKELDFDLDMDDIDDYFLGLEPIKPGIVLYVILMLMVILFARTPLYNLVTNLGLSVEIDEADFFFGPLMIAICFSPVVFSIVVPFAVLILLGIIYLFGKPGRTLAGIIYHVLTKPFNSRFGFLAYILYFVGVFFAILILCSVFYH